jgi:hypothetical protein
MNHEADQGRGDKADVPSPGPRNRRLPLDGKGWITLILVAIVAIAAGVALLIAL